MNHPIMDRVKAAVVAAIPDAEVIDLEVIDWDEWEAGDIEAGLTLTDVERKDTKFSAAQSFPDVLADLRDAIAADLKSLPIEWWAAEVSEHGYASVFVHNN